MLTQEMIDLFDLNGKVALVTGSGRGLGRAFAEAMAEAGADVVCTGKRIENTTETAQALRRLGCRALAISADVSKEGDVKRMIEKTIEEFGKLDILVNNAGVGGTPAPVHQLTLEQWHEVISVDLTGVFLCSREAIKVMMPRKSGKVINIASTAGLAGVSPPSPPGPHYCAAKGGVVNLTREMAVEYAPFGINVNCIAPAAFETDILGPVAHDAQFKDMAKAIFPLRGGIGQPKDLKGTVVYLASRASDFVTGHVLVVDQGFLAQ